MDWGECLKENVTKVAPNKEIARSLLKLCKARLEVALGMDEKRYPALIAESYYEIIKELLTALLALGGFKSYSHLCLVAFIRKYHSMDFSPHEIELVDKLRRIRNDVDYRGLFTGEDFIKRNRKGILSIIQRLKRMVEGKV